MKYIQFILILVVVASCKKIADVKVPDDFKVAIEKTTYQVSKEVPFKFTGNPDLVTFYSGELGNDYAYHDLHARDGVSTLEFTVQKANGVQTNSLQILVSDNFAGIGADEAATAARIAQATWTDVTGRVVVPATGVPTTIPTANTATPLKIDLSDFAVKQKPVFIAFKYNAAAGTIQNKWTVSAITVNNAVAPGRKYVIANHTSAAVITNTINGIAITTLMSPGWAVAKVSNTFGWVYSPGATATALVITGATTAALATAPSEAWAFSGPIDLRKICSDPSITPKEISARVSSYLYTYKAAGTYNATFVAANSTTYGYQEKVDSVRLTITP